MTSTIAVTGVTGFIGQAVAQRYLTAGWRVRGLDLRRPEADTGVEYVLGDVTDVDAVRELVAQADLVVHTAAIVAESGDWAEFDRVNARTPRTVALAARAAGARDFVHLSSVMVHGFDFPEGCAEDGPLDPADNPYCASKIRSEFLLRDLHDVDGMRVHIVRPGDVYGPGSVPWIVRPVQHMREGTFLWVDAASSVINHVYVDNLVDAIEVMVEKGPGGRTYIVTDGQRTLARDFFGWFADRVGMRWAPSLPGWLAEPLVGGLASVLPERARRRLDLDRQSIRYLRRRAAYSNAAIRDLGWEPRVDLGVGRERTAAWLSEVGLLP